MPSAELIGLQAPKKAHRSLVFALAAACRQIESAAGIAQAPLGATCYTVGPTNQSTSPRSARARRNRRVNIYMIHMRHSNVNSDFFLNYAPVFKPATAASWLRAKSLAAEECGA
jgi:hypothetical protein